jgi:putative NADH-flavin reductase
VKLAILGASGGVGRHLVQQALKRGHDVVALVRPSTPYEGPDGARVVRGEVLEEGVLPPLFEGRDAVLSSLGIRRKTANPWSRLVSPPDFVPTSAQRIVDAMRAVGVPRVVAVSSAGVAESAAHMNAPMRLLVATSNIGVAYRDLARMEQIYADSGVDWCCVRPVTLTDGAPTGEIRTVDHFGATMTISRADVAWAMLDRLAPGGERLPQIAAY